MDENMELNEEKIIYQNFVDVKQNIILPALKSTNTNYNKVKFEIQMPDIILKQSEKVGNNIQQISDTKATKHAKYETQLEIGGEATILDAIDEHQCTSSGQGRNNKSERLKTEQARMDITDHEFHTTTPIDKYHSECFAEFAIPIIDNKSINHQRPIQEAGENCLSSYSIKKPPRKSIRTDLNNQSKSKSTLTNKNTSGSNFIHKDFVSAEKIYNDTILTTENLEKQFNGDSNAEQMKSVKLMNAEKKFFDTESQHQTSACSVYLKEITTMSIEEKVTKFFDKQGYKSMDNRKSSFSSEDTPKSTFETFTKYFEILDSMDENGDSEVIRELVLSRYGAKIQNYLDKSDKRRSNLSLNKGISKESLRSIDSGNNSISDELICEEYIIQDGQFSVTIFEDILEEANGSNVNEHIKEKFFRELNEKYMSEQKTDIDTILDEEMETLFEKTSLTGENFQSGVAEEPIEEFKKNYEKTMKAAVETSRIENGETPEPERSQGEKTLLQKLYIQTATILEVSKALDFCKKFKEYSESVERIEAEHILLIATIRKGIILDEMTKIENEPIKIHRNGYVRLNNIRIPLIRTNDYNLKGVTHYVCVLQYGSFVFTSGILQPDNEMVLKIRKSFHLDELPHDFEISVQLYSLFIKTSSKNKKSSVILKDVNNAFYILKKYLSPRKTSRYNNQIKKSKKTCFVLCGKCMITKSTLQQNLFEIQEVYPAGPIANSLTCDIDYSVKIANRAAGFLTIGEQFNGILMWNRQWCILEDTKLKSWDYPGMENELQANRVIDMSRCMLKNIRQADQSLCCRPKTLHLQLGPESISEKFKYTDCFLSADNQDDFRYWSEQLNSILTTLILWNFINPYIG